jgi:hypothetical protein
MRGRASKGEGRDGRLIMTALPQLRSHARSLSPRQTWMWAAASRVIAYLGVRGIIHFLVNLSHLTLFSSA